MPRRPIDELTKETRMKVQERRRYLRRVIGASILLGTVVLLVIGCRSEPPTPTPLGRSPAPKVEASQIITLGDIDLDEPAKKIKRFQPLADDLAENLGEFGITEGRVVIARDIDEMAGLLKNGTVDIYLDSASPAMAVQEQAGSEFILRRSKNGYATYWSTFIALRNNGVESVEDFVGKVVAFEEPHSTSGFALPAGTLVKRGFTLTEVSGSDADVAPDEIGYFFSGDEENSVELVLRGLVAGAGFSNQDYDELPAEIAEQIITIDRTITVPRQLVSVRPGLDPELAREVSRLMVGLDQTEEGREILKGMKESKFDPLPSDTYATLNEMKELVSLVINSR